VRFRLVCLDMVLIITVLTGMQLGNLQVDNSNEAFFRDGDKTQLLLDQFKDTFGNDDFVFVLIDVEEAFDTKTLIHLGELAERLELEVPHLLELTWIGNVESITGVPGGIEIGELIPDLALDNDALATIKARALSDPLYRDRLVSAGSNSVGILMEFENYPDIGIDPRKDSPPVIQNIIADFSDLQTYVVGGPIMDYQMDADTAEEGPRWSGMAFLGIALMLILTTRSLIGVLVPLATIVLSVIWVMGIVATLGFTLNLYVIMVPTLLICVGVGYTMHVVAEFRQQQNEGKTSQVALDKTLSYVTRPIILTALTTAAGFLAFLGTDLVPLRELGVQAAIGVFVAFVLTYLFAVPVLSFIRGKPPVGTVDNQLKPDIFDRFLSNTANFVVAWPRLIFAGFVVLIVITGYGAAHLKIETSTIQSLPKDDPLRTAFEYVDSNMGGSMSLELMFIVDEEDGIKALDVVQDIEKLQNFLENHPRVIQTSSFLDQIKQMRQAMYENNPDYFALPSSRAQIAEYLLLYESGGGEQLDKYLSFTYDNARIQARTKSLRLGDIRPLEADIKQFIAANMPERNIQITGSLSLFSALADYIAIGQGRSFLYAFTAIALLMIISLRSIKLGLIAMIPNVLPVLFVLGVMGLAGIELNMVAMVLSPLILGVAVDDTVHFFVRFRRYFDELGDYELAYRETMRTVGRPLLFTTMVLAVGFLGFAWTKFDGPFFFAFNAGFAFATALFADFLLAPVLLKWLKPLGEPRPNIMPQPAANPA
ncbi:MAG: MMPL family transporter, partial [Pseudomonadota bacterium]